MAWAFLFTPNAMSLQQYNQCMQRLADEGLAQPAGRLKHVAFGDPRRVRIFDVWETLEDFEAFGAVLGPIMAELGVNPGEPMVGEVHAEVDPPA